MEQDRQNNFDLIRLLAALQVFYTHGTSWLELPQATWFAPFINMFGGVSVFFIVSGYLVSDSFLRNSDNLGKFALSRALRIYPGLWGNMAFITLLLLLDGAITNHSSYAIFFLVQMFVGSDWLAGWLLNSRPIEVHWLTNYPSGVLWTLSVEIGFYFLIAGALWFVRRSRARTNIVLASAFGISCAFSAYLGADLTTRPQSAEVGFLMNTPMAYFWIFLLGSIVRINWDQAKRFFEGKFVAWIAAYLAVYLLCMNAFNVSVNDFQHNDILVVIKIALMGGCIISFAYTWKWLAGFLRGNDISYGVYLYHMQVIVLLKSLGFAKSWYLWPTVIVSTVLLATASWLAIERPCLSLKTRGHRVKMSYAKDAPAEPMIAAVASD